MRVTLGLTLCAVLIAVLAFALTNSRPQPRGNKEKSVSSLSGDVRSERPKLYDTEADGNQQIAAALKKAQAEQKRVLLKFGANWCHWCHKLSKCFKENAEVARVLNDNFVLVLIDVDIVDDQKHNADVIQKYGDPTRFGLPVLVVLDTNGEQLTTKDTSELEDGDQHAPAKVLAFLDEWKPDKKRAATEGQ